MPKDTPNGAQLATWREQRKAAATARRQERLAKAVRRNDRRAIARLTRLLSTTT